MKKQLQQRLEELRVEFESGQKMMAELESKQANLRDTLLRINGAIQVLEEQLGEDSGESGESAAGALQAPEPVGETV